jgi:hypothetical protein
VLAVGSMLPLSFSVPASSAEPRANLPDRRKQAEGEHLRMADATASEPADDAWKSGAWDLREPEAPDCEKEVVR